MNRILCITCILAGLFYGAAVAVPADDLVARSGVTGGFVVHLGCGDGKLTAALHLNDRFTVQGLDADSTAVARARAYIQSQGLYGPVSIEQFDGCRLPYADNLINLMVVEDAGKVSTDEILRTLVPNGVALVKNKVTGWRKIVKPQSATTDEWSHFLHDAGNNAVANATGVGPPRRLQWVAPPLWLRSHETPSGVQAEVSSSGRLFYILDEGLIGIVDQRLPDRWAIVCRDAYNGKLLWKRYLKAWGWREWNRAKWEGKDWTAMRSFRMDVPQENERRLVAIGDRLYATLSYMAPMSILDAVTGDTLVTVEETRPAREIVVNDGIAVVRVDKSDTSATNRRRGIRSIDKSNVVAVDGDHVRFINAPYAASPVS
ncbi:MAG: class I SAM-dependent methyltransferase, partial [Candidatus Hydrogenedentes bacterium]|nr:class I SAM-dependent methyltransferase [Candidatus Hydrogenedentota bacterium]